MRSLILLAAAALLAACASSPEPPKPTWVAFEASGLGFGPPQPTLILDGNRISGRASCNQYSGVLNRERTRVTIRNLSVTEMACPAPVMEQETLYLSLLRATISLDASSPGELVMRTLDGRSLRFRSAGAQ